MAGRAWLSVRVSIEDRARITDPAVMRALAHPARLTIMEYLGSISAEATATECAEVVGLSPSATSYHLRALAKAGLIEDAPSRGDARERVWRSRARHYSMESPPDADQQTRAAEDALLDAFLTREHERLRAWSARSRQEPHEWYRATLISETIIAATAEELEQLNAELLRLIRSYHRAERPEVPPGARTISVQLRTFPIDQPGDLRS